MRRLSVLGLLTVVVLLIGMIAPAAYGQAMTPTPTATGAGTGTGTDAPGAPAAGTPAAGSTGTGALPTAATPSPDSAPGRTGTGSGTPIDSAPGRILKPSDQASSETVRAASDLLGARVRSSDDRRIGRIDNFLVDPNSGDVAFALVVTGGLLGFGEKLVAVPATALRFDPTGDEFIVGLDARTFEQAPSTTRYGSLDDAEFAGNTDLQGFWSDHTGSSGTDSSGTGTGTGSSGTGTGTGSSGTGTGTGSSGTGTGTDSSGTGTGTGSSGTGTGTGSSGTGTSTGTGTGTGSTGTGSSRDRYGHGRRQEWAALHRHTDRDVRVLRRRDLDALPHVHPVCPDGQRLDRQHGHKRDGLGARRNRADDRHDDRRGLGYACL